MRYHLIIIVSRLINVYRSFAPQHDVSQRDKFGYQLDLIETAFTSNTILLKDFNLDWLKRHGLEYSHRNYFNNMDIRLEAFDTNQVVDFITWTRTANGVVNESVLDHI